MVHLASGSETSQTLAADGLDAGLPRVSEEGWERLVWVKCSQGQHYLGVQQPVSPDPLAPGRKLTYSQGKYSGGCSL